MVSDQEIASSVESILRESDPKALSSVNAVVQQLEAKLGLDLSHKASFIRDQIDLLLRPQPPKDHFALLHHPQFHLHPQQIAVSPFTHLPHHHELTFRCPPSGPMPGAVMHPYLHQQQQQVPPPPMPMPKPDAGTLSSDVVQPPVAAAAESAPTGVKRRGGPGGLSKVCGVSPELQAIVGEPAMPRTQIVKQLWAYIRKNNLQDPANKRKIICNDELRLVFETDCTDMFKMNKLLAKHIIPLETTKDSGSDSKRLKTADVVSATEPDADQYPVAISDALANVFGTGEREMLQSEALRRVWDYIKVNQLEDPMNSMMILCDSKLQQLFGCESLSSLGVSEMLGRHLFKQS